MAKNPDGFGTFFTDGPYHGWKIQLGGRGAKPIVIKRKDPKVLKRLVTAKIAELEAKGFIKSAKDELTVRQHLERWLEHRVKPNRESSTYRSYRQVCACYVYPAIGKVKVAQLTALHIQMVVSHVQGLRKASGEPLSPRTAQYAITVLCAGIGRKARELREDVEVPSVDSARDRVLSHEEIDAVLAEADRTRNLKTRPEEVVNLYRDRHLLRFLLNAGVRISEALGVLVVKVDLKEGGVWITHQLERGENTKTGKKEWRLKEVLKGKEPRYVPLTEAGVAAVRGQLAMLDADKGRAGEGYEDMGLLFATEAGRPMRARNVARSLETILSRARIAGRPIEPCTLHDLRRSYGTWLADSEPRIQVVAAILGHKSVATTMKHYVRARELSKREAVAKIQLGTKKPEQGEEKQA